MAKTPTPAQDAPGAETISPQPDRVRLIWPATGAEAQPLAEDVPAWIEAGWQRPE